MVLAQTLAGKFVTPRTSIIALIAITAIALGAWLSVRFAAPPPTPGTATILRPALELPEFSLLDHDARPVCRDVFSGQWDLVFFGFTHCPDICPMTLQVLATARKTLAADGHSPLPRIVLVSVDPERDTPDVLREYVGYFGDGVLGITGELAEVRKLTDGLGVYFEKSEVSTSGYSVDHSAVVMLVNPDGQFQVLFGAPHAPRNFVEDLPLVMSGS
jgi:protein SCO1/2